MRELKLEVRRTSTMWLSHGSQVCCDTITISKPEVLSYFLGMGYLGMAIFSRHHTP